MIRLLLNIYIVILILDAFLGSINQLKAHPWSRMINDWAALTVRPLRKSFLQWNIHLSDELSRLLAPVVVILVIQIIKFLW